jgi:hypothetical protein
MPQMNGSTFHREVKAQDKKSKHAFSQLESCTLNTIQMIHSGLYLLTALYEIPIENEMLVGRIEAVLSV